MPRGSECKDSCRTTTPRRPCLCCAEELAKVSRKARSLLIYLLSLSQTPLVGAAISQRTTTYF